MKKLIVKILFISSVFLGFTQNVLPQQVNYEVDSVNFIEIVPDNLLPGQPPIVLFNDSITFRCEAFLKEWPPEQQKRVYVRTYLNRVLYSLHNNFTNVDVTCNSLIIPDNNSDPNDCGTNSFQYPIKIENFAPGLNEIYVMSWVNGSSADTAFSDTLRFIHPEPKVESVAFQNIEPSWLQVGTLNDSIFNDSIYFEVLVKYNDTLSINENICVDVFRDFAGNTTLEGSYSAKTAGEPNTSLVVKQNTGDKIKVTLGTHGLDYGLNDIYLKAWFCDFSTEPVFSEHLILDHPKPIITSIEFFDFTPDNLKDTLNHPIDIYNPEIKYSIKVNYNDYLSDDETIKMKIHHTKNGVLAVSEFSNQTIGQEPDSPFTEFKNIVPFKLGPEDFNSHRFRIYAWFDEDFTEIGDTIPSNDSLILQYRLNTPSIIEIATPYDKIYKFPNNKNVLIEGKVTDNTGIVDSVWVKVNGEIFDAVVPKQLPPGPFNFSFIIDSLKQPISQIYAWAKDTVPFCPPPFPDTISMLSINTDSTRLIYLKWDSAENNPPDTLYQVDKDYKFSAFPPGGIYSCITLDEEKLNKAGVFNPSKLNPGTYNVIYTFTTPPPFSEYITRNITIASGSGLVEGTGRPIESDVCDESFKSYIIAQTGDKQKVNWDVEGGLITQFNPDKKEIEVRWKDEFNFGSLEATVFEDDITNSFKLNNLFQIDGIQSPDKAYLVQHDSVLFCSLYDTTDYQYQWYKGEDEKIAGATKPYYYIGSANDLSYFVKVNYLCETCDTCQTKSFIIKGTEATCEECEVADTTVSLSAGQKIIDIENDSIMDIHITSIVGKLLKIIVYNETNEATVTELRMALKNNSALMPSSHVFRLVGLDPNIKYSVTIRDSE